LGFISVLDFYEYLSTLNTAETTKTELKPFLTILGTSMRACANDNEHNFYVFDSEMTYTYKISQKGSVNS